MSDEILLHRPELALGVGRPVITEASGVSPPENSELRKVAEDVLQSAMYTFAAVAADPATSVQPNSLASTFRNYLQEMKDDRRTKFQTRAQELVKMPEAGRQAVFGRYGAMDAEDMLAKGFENAETGLPALELDRKLLGVSMPNITIANISDLEASDRGLTISKEGLPGDLEELAHEWEEAKLESIQSEVIPERLHEIWEPVSPMDPYAASMTDFEEFEEQAPLDKLAFYITQIKCVDETNPELWLHDKIDIAGVSVDEDGDTKKIGEVRVGNNFDDGDRKLYKPHWRYTWFNMREGNTWPKYYGLTLLLAEIDYGGFSDTLNDVWIKIRDQVNAAIQTVIKIAFKSLGAAIASAIAKAVAWIIDKLIGWIINAFRDDEFPPIVRWITVPSFYARWVDFNGRWGSPVSMARRAHTYGHGGHYFIEYYWRMYSVAPH